MCGDCRLPFRRELGGRRPAPNAADAEQGCGGDGRGEYSQSQWQRGSCGHGTHQEGSAGVAKFPPQLG